MAPKKWYAVRKGHRTGIFESWDECQAATAGYSGAQFKSFKTVEEAQAYVAGGSGSVPLAAAPANTQPSGRGSSGTTAGGKFYAVARGRQVGIFDSWQQAKAMVEGYTNPVYRSFNSRQAAADFLAQNSSGGSSSGRAFGSVRGADDEGAGATAKRQRGDSYQAPAPPPAFSGQQQQQQQQPASGAQTMNPGLLPQHPIVTITFDGGSRNNPGRAGYGYAVFERQRSERLRMGCRPLPYGSTNNEAEYSGLIAGMRYSLEKLGARHIVARGDSQLVVRQMTGMYKVKGERLLPLHREAKMLEQRCESFQIEHIYREENSLADLLSNLAMDSDTVVDSIVQRWSQGAGREELAALLAAGAQVDGHISQINALRTAPCFMLAAAQLLAQLWDAMPVEEVTANLAARGWDEGTGGPPVAPLPLPLGTDPGQATAAAAAGAGPGTSGVVAAAVAAAMGAAAAAGGGGGRGRGVGRSSRGMQAVPVAPVALGQGWAQEVSRQEALMQQQQQRGAGSAGGGPAAAAAHQAQQRAAAGAAGVAPRLLIKSPVSDAAAASVAPVRFVRADCAVLWQLQRCRQRCTWPYSNGAVASMPYLARGQAELARSGRVRGLQLQLQQQQQHQLFSRMAQRSSSLLLRSSSSSSSAGSLRMRAGRVLTAAAAAAAGRLYRREADFGSSSSDSSRRQRGFRALTV